MKHMYVDNLLPGVNSNKEAKEFSSFSIHESGRMGFELKRISEVNSRAGQSKGNLTQVL